MKPKLILFVAVFALSFQQVTETTKQLSLNFNSRILKKGKYIVIEGEVYFKKNGGVLTTHLTRPFENVTIVNAQGDIKIYDPIANTITQSNNTFNSTETSYFWHFLNGSYNDMGLANNGYLVKHTKLEDGLMITNWGPKPGSSIPIADVEVVHEKNLPIFIGFKNHKNKPLGKIFFSAYQKIGNITFPSRITEISYIEKGDSVITTKSYSNPQINNKVNLAYLNYQIPANARVITQK